MITNRLSQLWREEDGVLSFEWTLLVTLLTIGIVSGLSAARDAIIDELGDIAEAAQGIDQSFSLSGIDLNFVFNGVPVAFSSAASSFQETAGVDNVFTDCARTNFTGGQGEVNDADGGESPQP
jgi:Flp pilus assembly pilin Flp